ncbi:MAG: hypothetical protein U0133_11815 [Gemmatimonadales bacterium]
MTSSPPVAGDLAHPARIWLLVRGLFWLAMAALFGLGLAVGIREVRAEPSAGGVLALLAGVPLTWWSLGRGLVRLRAGLLGEAFVRADTVGIHYRYVPDSALALGLGSPAGGAVRWDQLVKCSQRMVRYSGIPVTQTVFFHGATGIIGVVDLYPFREFPDELIEAVEQARP